MRNQYGLADLRQEVIVIPSYLIHEAVIKHLPWPVPMIVIHSDLPNAVIRRLQTVMAAHYGKGQDEYSGEGQPNRRN